MIRSAVFLEDLKNPKVANPNPSQNVAASKEQKFQNQTQTTLLSETPSRWHSAIHQTVLQRKGPVECTKVAANENMSETETAPKTEVPYRPSLPAPEGPFPPPAFTYNSPAHRTKITSGPETGNGPAPGNRPS